MKVMQINVWQGRLIKPLLALIRKEDPDIIMAQEIYSYPHKIAAISPWDYLSTLERIAAISYKHTYFSPCSTFEMFGKSLGYGNAIISKYPLANTSTHYTGGPGPIHYDEPSAFGGNDSRNFQHATVTTNTGELHLVNHHAHWADQPLGDETSTKRLGRVASFVSSLKGPIVTAGDFNVSPTSPAMTAFIAATGLSDITATTGATSTLSSAHYASNVMCDYLLASPDITIKKIQIFGELVSDHLAIFAEIDR